MDQKGCPWSLTLGDVWVQWKEFVMSKGKKQGPFAMFYLGLTCCVVGVLGLILLS